MEQNILKYYRFYESVRDFYIRLRYTNPEDVQGVTLEEIRAFEQKNNVTIPPVRKGQLCVFGRKSIIYNVEGSFYNSLETMQATLDWVRKEKILEEFKEKNYYLNESDYSSPEELQEQGVRLSSVIDWDNILFIGGGNEDSSYSALFVDQTQENPIVYFYGERHYVDCLDCTLLDMARNRIDLTQTLHAKNEYRLLKQGWDKKMLPPITDFTGIEWLKDYIYIDKESDRDDEMRDLYVKITRFRDQFSEINRKWEAEHNTIRTVEEFETEFLAYLRHQGWQIGNRYQ